MREREREREGRQKLGEWGQLVDGCCSIGDGNGDGGGHPTPDPPPSPTRLALDALL